MQPEPPASPGPELSRALLEHCRDHLAGYQLPRGFDYVERLERTATGKLARRTLRDRLRSALAAGIDAGTGFG